VLVEAKIAGGAGIATRNDVPPRSSVVDQVKRCQATRDVEGLVGRGGQRSDEPEVGRRNGECGEQREWLEAIEIVRRRVGRDELAVDDEDKVELGIFGDSRLFDKPVDIYARIAGDLRIESHVLRFQVHRYRTAPGRS
jgi:hypothetical protein